MHFEDVSRVIRTNQINRFQQYRGLRPLACYGGLALSLDLTKAFDLASRPIIHSTLAKHGVAQDTIQVIQQLHKDAEYIFRSGICVGGQKTTNGLKQGCSIAPYLWSFYTIALMQELQDRLDPQWLQQVLVLFADDHWCHWTICSRADFESALKQLTVMLETLIAFRMSINFKKTAILLRLEGKQAKAILREYTQKKNNELHLCIRVHDQEQLIPIKVAHEYLGTKVTYRHRLDANTTHRLQAGQAKYQALRKTLNGHHALHVRYRLRLWAACVSTSMYYSLPATGFTKDGLDRLTKAATRHIRAILRQPAHLTHTDNHTVWQQTQLNMPGDAILQMLRCFRARLQAKAHSDPDITTGDAILQHLQSLEDSMSSLLRQQDEAKVLASAVEPQIACPQCDQLFPTENAMRIHCKLAHSILPTHSTSTPTTFVPSQHAKGGLPQCRLCLRTFHKWQNLKQHIQSGACDKLGGESLTKHPVRQADVQASSPSAQQPTDEATGTAQNAPLIERPSFVANLCRWESLLRDSRLHSDLQAHCVLCHMWCADHKHVKQHILRTHECGPRAGTRNNALSFISLASHTLATFGGTMSTQLEGLNPEADIFAFCCPNLLGQHSKSEPKAEPVDAEDQQEDANPTKRPRPEPEPATATAPHGARRRDQRPFHRGPKPSTAAPQTESVRLIAKALLQHEDQLAAQRMDKSFILFVRQDQWSVIPQLHQISKDWNAKRESGEPALQSPLRTVLFACLLKEMMARIQRMTATDPPKEKLKAADWMDSENAWTFLRYCHKDKKMILNQNKASMTHTELIRILTFLLEHTKGEIVHAFHSTVRLDKLEAAPRTIPMARFKLDISLRGERAHEVHEALTSLVGSSAWQLVGINMRQETLQRSPIAQQLAKLAYGQ
ncbi:Pol [Symbiodinium sp. CCMP2592]|nr:Pol [Symbiodinium sp. CCMP2592]